MRGYPSASIRNTSDPPVTPGITLGGAGGRAGADEEEAAGAAGAGAGAAGAEGAAGAGLTPTAAAYTDPLDPMARAVISRLDA
ncbi:MAG: hypothetical protein FJW39_09230 [Acidobacteria bacterium]|nr:hypothetical protein [Acidobacteriota bacterium]